MSLHAETAARLEKLRGFLEADPKNPTLLAESADVAMQLGLAKDAHGWIERALAARPDDPHMLARLANAKLALGETKVALEILEPLVKADPAMPLQYNYGYALLRNGRYPEAKEALTGVMKDPSAPANTAVLLTRTLHYLGELEQAIETARAYAEAHPDDAVIAGMLSLLYLDVSNWGEARRWSRQALKGQPENLDALIATATVALADEKEDEAQRGFEKVLKAAPGTGRAWAGLATAAMMKFDIATAQKHFERAVEAMPAHFDMLNSLAWCQMLQRDYEGAKKSLERSLALNRSAANTHGALAMLAAFQGHWDEAEQHGKRARGLDPEAFGGRMVEIMRMQSNGQGELARQTLLKGLRAVAAPGGGTLADLMTRTIAKHRPGR